MTTEQGIVLSLGGETALVKTARTSACEGCVSKGSCHAVGDNMEVEALNLAGAKIGDRIIIRFDTSPFLKATFLIYVFPIICLIVGAFIGQHLASILDFNPSGGAAAAGFACFFLAILFVKSKGNRLADRDDYKPKITRILRPR